MDTIITGASSGLGLALCNEFLRQGETVIGLSRTTPKIEHPNFKFISLDLNNLELVESTFKDLSKQLDTAQKLCVINNAGSLGNVSSLSESSIADLSHIFNVNTIAPIWISGWATKQGAAEINIINISSGAARSAYEGWGEYCSSKSALKMACQVMGAENQSKNKLSILNLEPGVIDTPMQDKVRNSDPKSFPKLSKFTDLYKNDELLDPDMVAIKIYNWTIKDHKSSFIDTRIKKELEIPIT